MEYFGMKIYYSLRRDDLRLSFQPHRAGYETRMLTAEGTVLLYLFGTRYFRLVYKSEAVARPRRDRSPRQWT